MRHVKGFAKGSLRDGRGPPAEKGLHADRIQGGTRKRGCFPTRGEKPRKNVEKVVPKKEKKLAPNDRRR